MTKKSEEDDDDVWIPPPFQDYDDCNHDFKRLFYVRHLEEYGETIRYARLKKCFNCKTIIKDDE